MKLAIAKIEAASIALNNRLCRKQCYFQGEEGGALSITLATRPSLSGYRLTAIVGSHTLSIDMSSAQLQQRLSNILRETSFDSLPDTLQLELLGAQLEPHVQTLKQQFGQLPLLNKLEPINLSPADEQTLMITVSGEDATLCLWLAQGHNALVDALPDLKSKVNQQVRLPMSLCIGTTQLPVRDFSTLAQSDVIFFDDYYFAEKQLVMHLSGQALWRCELQDQTIQILNKEPTMNDIHNQEPVLDHQQLPVELTFDLGYQTLTLEQLNQLQPGYIFELDQPITKPVTVRANGKVIGQGELVNANDRLGVRLLDIFSGE